MKPTKHSFPFVFAAIIMVAAFSAIGQSPRPNFNRPQTFDAQHYTIRASFDRVNKKVFGDTTVSLKPLAAGFRVVELDAVSLAFDSVKLESSGIDLQYKVVSDKISITLDKAYGPDDLISIRLKYTASPKKGVYFVAADEKHSSQVWTQGEAEEARHWFPSFDFPSDKATTEEYITAEKGETVIGNGELLDKIENENGTVTWHYKMPVPHSIYLVSFVIGKYTKIEDRHKETPLGFYVYPGKEGTALKAFGDTKKMLAVFEELTGVPFPFNKYDQTVVSQFKFGGMENITATTMSDTDIFIADFDFGKDIVTDLVSHELAHSWFGDLVTCRNWAELWLNEGFATYMEAAYLEKAVGRDSYLGKVRTDAAVFLVDDVVSRKRHALYNLRAGDADALFDNPAVTYNKGGVVLHMLREQVGTDIFWRAINVYLNRHKFANVESTDLQKVMEEVSGQNLKWFFDQWVYAAGVPQLKIGQTYNPRTKTLAVTITQTQKIDPITPTVFRLPLDISIKTTSGETAEKIDVSKRVQTFIFKTANPTEVLIDKDEKVPLKRVTMSKMVLVR
ncbi:MAG: M1 family metallopeptidase [Chloracidobacterium sp.]|nr:M1 family metallopeptidase [Chloracidobacterium sp.]